MSPVATPDQSLTALVCEKQQTFHQSSCRTAAGARRHVHSPLRCQVVTLNFTFADIANDLMCVDDRIDVYDGPTPESPRLMIVCEPQDIYRGNSSPVGGSIVGVHTRKKPNVQLKNMNDLLACVFSGTRGNIAIAHD